MSELNENQLLLLDNLIYLEGVAVEGKDDITVKEIIEELLQRRGLEQSFNIKAIVKADEYPVLISYDRWREILTNIKNDPTLMSLNITNPRNEIKTKTVNGEVHEIGGMRAACFVDTSGSATVVFRGTHGAFEWHDNGEGGYLPNTVQQKEALDYIEGLTDYNNITVTGHSKGGNKAQYVSILSNKIDRCVSFDGQGFSKEFLDEHKDEIAANRHKITSISASSDYVNCLLFPVAEKQRYIETEREGKGFKYFHCPDIMLKLNGDLRGDTKQSAISILVNKFTEYVIINVKEPKRSYVIDGLVAKLEGKDADESPEQRKKSLKMLTGIGVSFVKKELVNHVKNTLDNLGKKGASVFHNFSIDTSVKDLDSTLKKTETKGYSNINKITDIEGTMIVTKNSEELKENTRESDLEVKGVEERKLVHTLNIDAFKSELLCNLKTKDNLNAIAMQTDDLKVKKFCVEKLIEVNSNLDKVEVQISSRGVIDKATVDEKIDYLKQKVNDLQRYSPKNKMLNNEHKEEQINELNINIIQSSKTSEYKDLDTINKFCNISSKIIEEETEIREMSEIYKEIDILEKGKIDLVEIKCNLEIIDKYKPIVETYNNKKVFIKTYENKYINEISKYNSAGKYLESKEITNWDKYNKAKEIHNEKEGKLENKKSLHSKISNKSAINLRLELSKSKKKQREFIKSPSKSIITKEVSHKKDLSLEM